MEYLVATADRLNTNLQKTICWKYNLNTPTHFPQIKITVLIYCGLFYIRISTVPKI